MKDEARLHAAYNDAAGVTAEFNRNILRVVNTHLCADFEPEAFEHVAFYDREKAWIEMRLRATRDMQVSIPGAALDVAFRPGDEIRTELSCKYTRPSSLEAMLSGTGLRVEWLVHRPRRALRSRRFCAAPREEVPPEGEP